MVAIIFPDAARFSSFLAALCLCAAACGAWPGDKAYDDPARIDEMRAYYRAHARISKLGLEQRLGNGVAWRVLTDGNTGKATPRITWMPDRQALMRANRLFDALQGAELYHNRGYPIYRDANESGFRYRIDRSFRSVEAASGFGTEP